MGCSVSTAPDHPDLHVQRNWGVPKLRRGIRVSGLSPPVTLLGFQNNINTLERAVKERVFFVKKDGVFVSPPRPKSGHFKSVMSDTFNTLKQFLPLSSPLTHRQFVDTVRGVKRKVYERAFDSLLRSNLSSKDAQLKVFVKYEKTNFTDKSDPVPRVVSPRDPRFNVCLGSYLKPIEERIFKSLGKLFGDKTVMKGMNAQDSAQLMHQKWLSFTEPIAVGLDASRFDQHVSLDALDWEHSIYMQCFMPNQLGGLRQLLNMQRNNQCSGFCADGKLKYQLKGGRMSGDMNTSLGNCVLMCSLIHAYSRHCGVHVKLANNGDDCVVFMEKRDLTRFVCGLDSWFLAMGFTMAIESPCHIFEQIEFCQTHPVWVGPGEHFIMTRHPRTALAKDTVALHNYNTPKMFAGWLDSVGRGGISMTGGLPVWQAFYSTYIKYGKPWTKVGNVQSWGVRSLIGNLSRNVVPIESRTRASFYWAFGITPCEQMVMERYYASAQIEPLFETQLTYQSSLPY